MEESVAVVESWQATMELRWLIKSVGMGTSHNRVLQQKWVNQDGKDSWRDVLSTSDIFEPRVSDPGALY